MVAERIAYLVLAHDKPDQLARLVNRLPTDSPVYVHFDRRGSDAEEHKARALLSERPGTTFVRRHRCRWGGYGIVRATLELIGALIGSGEHFDRATLMSGSCYPIKTNAEIDGAAAPGVEYIESFRLDVPPNRWSDDEELFRIPDRLLARHVRFRSHVRRIGAGLRRLPGGMAPFGGAQWWTLTRPCLIYVHEFARDNPRYRWFLHQSFIPDELFFQTIISNSPFAERVEGDDRRFAIWNRPEPPYPALLGIGDLDALLSCPAWFGRKFDLAFDERVLDELDAVIDRRNQLTE